MNNRIEELTNKDVRFLMADGPEKEGNLIGITFFVMDED